MDRIKQLIAAKLEAARALIASREKPTGAADKTGDTDGE